MPQTVEGIGPFLKQMAHDKVHKVMSEYKRGKLKSSSGKKVTSRKQAIAIALAESRRAK